MPPAWIDSHCHLQDSESLPEALDRATALGVSGFVCIGTTPESSLQAISIAETSSDASIWATVGIHPHTSSVGTTAIAELLAKRTETAQRDATIVAVGECGLDYHYDYSPREDQRRAFVEQIALAKAYDLALVIHTREAWDDTFAILAGEGPPERTVIHCFTGGETEARRCLDLGAYLSFSGIVTFKTADDVRAAAVICPEDRILVETDAPYLAPVPHRGRPNEPAFVAIVGEAVATLRSLPVEELAATTVANTRRVFALEP